jgi:formylglycine-generating enzyme required for sulfatase activity
MLTVSGVAQAIAIDTVSVGNAGNLADSTTYGSVAYNYNIGKYEVTAGQYAAFLNAKATTDTYSLYNTNMSSTETGSGITRDGTSGSYTYSVASAFVNRPVNYVSFWDATRFTNWLHNGQGNGDTENGAYTLTVDGIANNTITRNAGATWAVTSSDEWYKAAYYKSGGTNVGYWDYATQSDVAPGRDMTDASGNNANNIMDFVSEIIIGGGAWPIDSGKYTTVAGEFQKSESAYGTFDQGGNVWEWNDAITANGRLMWGGGFGAESDALRAGSYLMGYSASAEVNDTGFRVSVIPEPATMTLLGIGAIVLRRKTQKDKK